MNPLTNMKNVTKLSERELHNNGKSSWHDQYRDSAWIFIGGFPYDLTEGDIICIFSQYGEVVNINLIRDKDSGKSKGFCFLCYEDQRSTVLAVDNLNGIKVLNRSLRVDHVSNYKIPKEGKKTDEETKKLYNEGCAPKPFIPVAKNPLIEDLEYRRETLADQIQADIKLPARLPIRTVKKETDAEELVKVKTEKTNKKKKKKKSREHSTSEDEDKTSSQEKIKKKKKKDSKKKRPNSDSDSEFANYTSKKRRSRSLSDSESKSERGNIRPKRRSRSIERHTEKERRPRTPEKRSKFREYGDERVSKRRSRSREYDENSHIRKQYDSKRYDKHRRRSRS